MQANPNTHVKKNNLIEICTDSDIYINKRNYENFIKKYVNSMPFFYLKKQHNTFPDFPCKHQLLKKKRKTVSAN
jgi:hypothetical protein